MINSTSCPNFLYSSSNSVWLYMASFQMIIVVCLLFSMHFMLLYSTTQILNSQHCHCYGQCQNSPKTLTCRSLFETIYFNSESCGDNNDIPFYSHAFIFHLFSILCRLCMILYTRVETGMSEIRDLFSGISKTI